MQVRLGRIAERWDLRSCQNDIARSGWTAGPALQQIAEMNGAKFILIRTSRTFQPHRHECYLGRCLSEKGAHGCCGGDQRSGIKAGSLLGGDDALSAGAGALNDGSPLEIGL